MFQNSAIPFFKLSDNFLLIISMKKRSGKCIKNSLAKLYRYSMTYSLFFGGIRYVIVF